LGYGPFTGLAGSGSIWVFDGDRHRRERQLLAPAFHAQHVRGYGQMIQATTRTHTDRWQPGQPIRAYDAMLGISRDVVLRVVFGVEGGPLLAEGRRVLADLLHCVRPSFVFLPMLQTWWYPPWRRYARAARAFQSYTVRCVAGRRVRGEIATHDAPSVLDLLLAPPEDGESPRTEDALYQELGTIVFSGHETTAVALSWALYEVARHPGVLRCLRAELDALGPDAEPDLIAKQPYLSAVCDETLRLHTILTEVGRVVTAPTDLCRYTLPAATGVGVGIYGIHHDPDTYPEPYRFRPERFLERTYSPFEFLPFGGGHRRCPGATLSDFEMRIALATILTRWELAPDGEDEDSRHNIGMGPKYGVPLRVRGRRQVA
jgi:cytochrome P450 family 110